MEPRQIAPKSSRTATIEGFASSGSGQRKGFVCLHCSIRKTKCDKAHPTCGTCRRLRIVCVYKDESATGRKRKATEDVGGRIDRYERALAQHGLNTDGTRLPQAQSTADSFGFPTPASTVDVNDQKQSSGKLLINESNSRYLNSALWRDYEHQDLGEIVEEEAFTAAPDVDESSSMFPQAALSSGLLGAKVSLLEYHPSPQDAITLWNIYATNVEPLYKFLHTPSTHDMVTTMSSDPSRAKASDHCLLFAIYLLAVHSMDEDTCLATFGQTKTSLHSQYDYCLRQSLFNAKWLSINHVNSLLAFTMYFTIVRRHSDPRSLWIWTGMAIRIMQSMGIHRDGESMSLRLLDVELRRRLYWHLISLDAYAGRISGCSDSPTPSTWDTRLPSNINDSELHTSTTSPPPLRPRATEMMLSLIRIKLSTLQSLESPHTANHNPSTPAWNATERTIDSLENEIESQFLRYCDPIEPVHALSLVTARSSISAARLRQRMPLITHPVPGREVERGEIYTLARRIIDAEIHTFSNSLLKPFAWYLRTAFRWDALLCLLVALARREFLSEQERQGAWERIEKFYACHTELLEAKNTLQRIMGRVTLMAWLASPPVEQGEEPEYITGLRGMHGTGGATASSQKGESDFNAVDLDDFPAFDVDASFDLTTFLNSGMFGTENDLGWLEGNFRW